MPSGWQDSAPIRLAQLAVPSGWQDSAPGGVKGEPLTLSLELLGAPLHAARRLLRAARSVQPRAARRPLDAARRSL